MTPHAPRLLAVRVVDGVGGVEVLAVLGEDLGEHDMPLVSVDIVIGVSVHKEAGQSGVGMDIKDHVYEVGSINNEFF